MYQGNPLTAHIESLPWQESMPEQNPLMIPQTQASPQSAPSTYQFPGMNPLMAGGLSMLAASQSRPGLSPYVNPIQAGLDAFQKQTVLDSRQGVMEMQRRQMQEGLENSARARQTQDKLRSYGRGRSADMNTPDDQRFMWDLLGETGDASLAATLYQHFGTMDMQQQQIDQQAEQFDEEMEFNREKLLKDMQIALFDKQMGKQLEGKDLWSISQDLKKQYGPLAEQSKKLRELGASLQSDSAMADVATVFNVIKMLDPGSVVRSSEQELLSKATSLIDRIKLIGDKAREGNQFRPTQREELKILVNELAQIAKTDYEKIKSSDIELLTQLGANPEILLGANMNIDFTPIPLAAGSDVVIK